MGVINSNKLYGMRDVVYITGMVICLLTAVNIHFPPEEHRHNSETTVLNYQNVAILSADVGRISQHPFNLNFPDLLTEETEEKEENLDDDWTSLYKISIYNDNLFGKVQGGSVDQNHKKLKTVPLFILFHSWKISCFDIIHLF